MIYVIGFIVTLVVVLVLFGAVYEIIQSQQAKAKFATPPGTLMDVGGYQLHMITMGDRREDDPVVILEASVGANSLDWQMVQPLIAEFAQVIAYDRAGNGWSDNGTAPRNPQTLAEDLKKLLDTADIEPPYIVVGHRYGGMYVRKYQELYPDDVAGLVLVDASHPEVFNKEDNSAEITRLQRNVNIFQKLGLVRLVTRRNYRVTFLRDDRLEQYVAMMMHDNPNLLAEAKPILEHGITLPDSVELPLTVVSRKEDEDLARERDWAEKQRDLALISSSAKHVHTSGTSSWVVFADPKTIAKAVKDMIDSIKNN